MQPSSKIIISDTSCIILLHKINEIELLHKFNKTVCITSVIKAEFNYPIPPWIEIKDPTDKQYSKILALELDEGETSAIALSLEIDDSILLIDDLKGRRIAEKLKLRYSGTFGLILRAKQEGIIGEIKPIIEKIKKTNFRFSEILLKSVLEQAGE